MSDLTPERRDKMRRAVTECTIPMDSTMWPVGGPTFLALLDAADERDKLAAAVERVRQACHELRYVRNVPGSLAFEQGRRDALDAVLAILDGTDDGPTT